VISLQISCSILNSLNRLADVEKINKTKIDYIHIDVMDGKFVLNKQYKIDEIIKINDISLKKLDVHLMVENPISYIDKLALCNIEYITFHEEVNKDKLSLIKTIKSYGFKCGISIKPNTSIETIYKYLNDIDLILIMSVEPGLGGQAFIENTYEKIVNLKKEIAKRNSKAIIEVDGGINLENIKKLKEIKTDICVIGSYLTKDGNIIKNYENLKDYIN